MKIRPWDFLEERHFNGRLEHDEEGENIYEDFETDEKDEVEYSDKQDSDNRKEKFTSLM